MKLIVGLGNPGKKYQDTRHNIGFVIVDLLHASISSSGFEISDWELSKKAKALYSKTKVKEETIELLKPQTYMNDSGISVSYAKNKHKIDPSDTYIVHDDLDIKLGKYKIQNKGPKEHNGLQSIYESIGTKDFWHVRAGVDNRDLGGRVDGQTYVLQKFENDELATIGSVVGHVVESLLAQLTT